jgi:ketosteroid isomerase-like protein
MSSSLGPSAVAERFLALLASGDIEAWLELLDDDIVIETPFAPAGEPTVFRGREQVDARFGAARRRMRSLEFVDLDVESTRTTGRVLVRCASRGRMGDGTEYANRYCWIIDTAHDPERIVAVTEYFDPQPVLAARRPMVGEASETAVPAGPAAAGIDDEVTAWLATMRAEHEIRALMVAYCDRIDANDPAGAAACFAADGIGHYWGEYRGPAAITERLVEILDEFSATSHHLTNVAVTWHPTDPDKATAQSYVYAFHRRRADGSSFHYWGRWVDELVRTRHGWRFHRREVVGAGGYEPGDRRRNRSFPGHPGRLDRPPGSAS